MSLISALKLKEKLKVLIDRDQCLHDQSLTDLAPSLSRFAQVLALSLPEERLAGFKSIGEFATKADFDSFMLPIASLTSTRVLLTQSIDVSRAVNRELAYQAILAEPAMIAPIMPSAYSHEI